MEQASPCYRRASFIRISGRLDTRTPKMTLHLSEIAQKSSIIEPWVSLDFTSLHVTELNSTELNIT